jgi:DNA-directed RNA polymerase specialized sigma24 family protein
LQPEQQRVLALKLLRGLRFAEVGTELGVTPAAAKMRFVRALRALREELGKEGVEP